MVATIAVVDDDRDILDAVKLLLEGEDWKVLTYADGEAFLGDLQGHSVDCVLLDPHLPGLSGADIAQSKRFRSKHIPFIGFTACPGSRIALAVQHAGARVMLTKPVAADELILRIRQVVEASNDD